jgi:hypothetical protein
VGLPATADIGAKITGLSAADFQKIVDLPQTVQTLIATAKSTLDAVRGGGNAANPAGAFFKTLSTLGADAGAIPGLDQVIAPITSLVGDLPQGLGDPTKIAAELDQALKIVGPLKDAIASGNVEQAVEKAVEDLVALAGTLAPGGSDLTRALGDAETFFQLFAAITGWKHAPPDPAGAAAVLGTALFGLSHDAFDAPASALETALAPLQHLAVGGPDVDGWHGAGDACRTAFTAIAALASAPAVDWGALRTAVNAAHAQLLEIAAARDRAFALTLTAVGDVSFGSFDTVAAAAQSVPPPPPKQADAALDGIRLQLRTFTEALGKLDLTPDEARAMVRDFAHSHADALADTALGQARVALVNGQQRVLDLIDDLPFAALADEVHTALRKAATALQVIDPDLVKKPLHDFFAKIEDKLDGLPHDQIKAALAQIWATVGDALGAVQAEVDKVVALLHAAGAKVKDFVDSVPFDEIAKDVDAIKAEIENFDLETAAQSVIAEIGKLHDVVAAIDVSKLPSPAVGLLKTGADALRHIDVAGLVNPPLAKELDKIDPTPALEQALKALSGVTDTMTHLSVPALASKLDAPVDELLAKLHDFGPDGLKVLIEKALQPVKDSIKQLDAAVLLAPLLQIYQQLMAKVRDVLDPDKLFAPLEKLYQPVLDVIDFVEPLHLLSLLEPHGGTISNVMQGTATLPGAVSQGTTALKGALTSSVADVHDDLLGMRPGDLLIPLIDVHRAIAGAVDAVSDEVLAAAGGHLFDGLVAKLRALSPIEIHARVTGTLDVLVNDYDPLAFAARAADGIVAYERARAAIESAASAQLVAADAAIAVDVQAALPALDPRGLSPNAAQHEALLTASATLTAKLDLSALAPVVADIERSLGPVIAPLANLAQAGAAEVRSLLAALDPAPIRDEINALFEELGAKIAQASGVLDAVLDEIGKAIEELIQPYSPANVLRLAQTLHAAIRHEAEIIGPAAFKDDIRRIFAVVEAQLAIADPHQLVDEINGLRDHLVGVLDHLVDDLLPDAQPFNDLMVHLAALKPSALLGPVTADLQPLTDLIAKLSPDALLAPVIDAIAHVKSEIPTVVEEIVAALDDVLAAFPDGGPAGAGAALSV